MNYQCKKECQDKLIDTDVEYIVGRDECDNLPTKNDISECKREYRLHDFNTITYNTYAGNRTRHKKGKRNTKRRVR